MPEDLVAVDDRPGRVDGDAAGRRRRRARSRRRRRAPSTASASAAGRGRARPDVDVHPVGPVVDHLDRRARRGDDLRADTAAGAVGAVEDDLQRRAQSIARARPSAVLDVAIEERSGRRTSGRARRSSARRSSSARQISCSSSSSTPSSSFSPSASRTLRPLSSAGLCDAETMIPAAKSPAPVEVGQRRRGHDADAGGRRRRGSSRRP